MLEQGNRLYIRTCHQLYRSSDGKNHQANMTIALDMDSMNVISSNHAVSNYAAGYVSHSFNQFLAKDGDTVPAADHGDGFEAFPLKGEVGNNYTGATLGGLAASRSSYLLNVINLRPLICSEK